MNNDRFSISITLIVMLLITIGIVNCERKRDENTRVNYENLKSQYNIEEIKVLSFRIDDESEYHATLVINGKIINFHDEYQSTFKNTNKDSYLRRYKDGSCDYYINPKNLTFFED